MTPPEMPPFEGNISGRRFWGGVAALALVTLLAYSPVWNGSFLWDDDLLLTNNSHVQSPHGLREIWLDTGSSASRFEPHAPFWLERLTLTMFWFEWRLWGENPVGYLVVNVMLHALAAMLLWRVLGQIKINAAWHAALVFAVHPVCVSSVAWISERKNTLSMVFYLLAALAFLHSDSAKKLSAGKRTTWFQNANVLYGLSLLAFALALLSKPSVVMLPVVLLGCVWWRSGAVGRADFWRITPFFALSGGMSLLAIWAHERAIGAAAVQQETMAARVVEAAWAAWFYFFKTIVPVKLNLIYPRWELLKLSWIAFVPFMALALLFFIFWKRRHGWGRAALFGAGYFVVSLAPVMGLIDTSFLIHSRVADHWQYLALPGMIALLTGGVCAPLSRSGKFTPPFGGPALIVFLPLLALLMSLTWQRARIFASEEKLWRDTLEKNPAAWAAHANLSRWLSEQEKFFEAEAHGRAAVELRPQASLAHYNLGNALFYQGKYRDAVEAFSAALGLNPHDTLARGNLATALAALGKLDKAEFHFAEAARMNPANLSARVNLALVLDRRGRTAEAMEAYREVLRLAPDHFEAHSNLGRLLGSQGRLEEALEHCSEAVRARPDSPEAHNNLAMVFKMLGQLEKASVHFRRALELDSNNPARYRNLAEALDHLGRQDEAERLRARGELLTPR